MMEDLTLTMNMGGEGEEETSVDVEGESAVDERKDETNIKKEKENERDDSGKFENVKDDEEEDKSAADEGSEQKEIVFDNDEIIWKAFHGIIMIKKDIQNIGPIQSIQPTSFVVFCETETLAGFDQNGDGVISGDEFRAIMRRDS